MASTSETRRFRDATRMRLMLGGLSVMPATKGMEQPKLRDLPFSIIASAARPRGHRELIAQADDRAVEHDHIGGAWVMPLTPTAADDAPDSVAVLSLASFINLLKLAADGHADKLAAVIAEAAEVDAARGTMTLARLTVGDADDEDADADAEGVHGDGDS